MNTALVKDVDNFDTSSGPDKSAKSGSVPVQMDFPRHCGEYNALLGVCREDGHAASAEYVRVADFEGFYRAVNHVFTEYFYWREMGQSGPYTDCYIDGFFERKLGASLCDLPVDAITDSLVIAWLDGWDEGLRSQWAKFRDRALGHCEAGSEECADDSDDE